MAGMRREYATSADPDPDTHRGKARAVELSLQIQSGLFLMRQYGYFALSLNCNRFNPPYEASNSSTVSVHAQLNLRVYVCVSLFCFIIRKAPSSSYLLL